MFRYPRSSVIGVVLFALAIVGVVPAADLAAPAGEDPAVTSVIPPRILLETQRAPEYPPAALAARFTGTVVVKTRILPDGKVGMVQVVECDSPNLGFEEATVEAVKKWEFQPALKEGVPVDYTQTFKLNFGNPDPGGGEKGVMIAGGTDARTDRLPAASTGPK